MSTAKSRKVAAMCWGVQRLAWQSVQERIVTEELRHKPGHLVWRAYQLTWALFAEEAGALDITPVQEALMLVLASSPGIDQKTLAELVALDRSTAGNVIGRLQERGLIERVPNDSDRRARKLSLTPRGEAMSKKLRPVALRAAKRLLSPLGPLERPEFMRLLRKVTCMADPLDLIEPTRPSGHRLVGTRMLIVGLSDGFGREIVERIEAEGAEIAEVSSPDLGRQPAKAGFDRNVKTAIQRLGKVDVLLNGGGIGGELSSLSDLDKTYGHIQHVAASRWTAMMRVLPHLVEHGGGRIINLSAMPNTKVASQLLPALIAANAAVVTLTREVATDYRRNGIVANSISPRLERSTQLDAKDTSTINRLSQVAPADVAATATYLASADARFVSASDLILG